MSFGLSYAAPEQPEVADTTKCGEKNVYYAKGTAWNGYKLSIGDSNASHPVYVGTRTTLYASAGLMLESQPDGRCMQRGTASRKHEWKWVRTDPPISVVRG